MEKQQERFRLKLDLTEDQIEVLETAHRKKFQLSCDLISNLWRDHWDRCPLCGAELIDGIIEHNGVQ